jgi:hypothetical protein
MQQFAIGTHARAGGPAVNPGGTSPAAMIAAALNAKAAQGLTGYKHGYGNGLPGQAVLTREVCEWLQVPAILEELQVAVASGKKIDIRLSFPAVNGADRTQEEIKKFFKSYHSRSFGEMNRELESRLISLQGGGAGGSGFDAKQFLAEFPHLTPSSKGLLMVTDIVDLNSASGSGAPVADLIVTLTDAAVAAGNRNVAIVVDKSTADGAALKAALKSPTVDIKLWTNMRVWDGQLTFPPSPGKRKDLDELTLAQFIV